MDNMNVRGVFEFMEFIGTLFLLVVCFVGVAFILLGVKAFSPGGLPVSRKTNITGRAAKVVGFGCIAIGGPVLLLSAAVLIFGLSAVASVF